MTVCRARQWEATALIALGLAASPLAAQNVPDASPPPSSNGVVGPRELEDFSLPGAVVRPAEPDSAVPARPRSASPTPTPPTEQASPAPRDNAAPAPTVPTRRLAPTPTPTAPQSSAAAPPSIAAPPIAADVSTVAPAAIAPVPSGGAPWWPWVLALLAAAGAAAFVYFRRQHGREELAFAGAGLSETVPVAPRPVPPQPHPQPQPQPRAPSPPPRAPVPPVPAPLSGGIVSTALKPELELIFTPLSVAVDGAGTAMVVFDLVVHNHGSAPARDVLVEAGMFNAGPDQDRLIGEFFASPRAEGDRIPLIAPMGKVGVRSRVSIPAERIGDLEMAGRKLLIPLVAFNTIFRWVGGETQRSASFLVGRGNNEEAKLAPFALDRGARAWGDVAARSHSMGLAG